MPKKTKAKSHQQSQSQTHGHGQGKDFHIEFLNSSQKMAWATLQKHDITFLVGCAGVAKTFIAMAFAIQQILSKEKDQIILTRPVVEAGESLGFLPGPQPLDAKILTPDGWSTMGEIKTGDFVIGQNGLSTKVLNVYPKGEKLVYKITTCEGTTTECCEDHLWLTQTFEDKKRKRAGSVKTTKQMMDTLFTKKGKPNHYIPRNEKVIYNTNNSLPLSPYLLGVLLGDGTLGQSNISIFNTDSELIERFNTELDKYGCTLSKPVTGRVGYYVKCKDLKSKKPGKKVKLTNLTNGFTEIFSSSSDCSKLYNINKKTIEYRCKVGSIVNNFKYEFLPLEKRWANPIKNIIDDLGLLNKKALNKSIPQIYKEASVEDRIELLRGLLDTDGSIKKDGYISYTTISKQLALDVIEIVRSLGGRAVLHQRKSRTSNKNTINGRIIHSRHTVYEFDINFKDINPFYISRKANRFNTKYLHKISIKSIEPVCKKQVQCILVDNKDHLYLTDDFLVTHNTAEEKLNPYMMPLYDTMDKLLGKQSPLRDKVQACVKTIPLAFMRGTTFDNSIAILDEAQNTTPTQIKLFLTRLGKNSKMIITGDPYQTDLFGNNSLPYHVNKLKEVPGIGMVEFKDTAIVRHPLIGKILEKLDGNTKSIFENTSHCSEDSSEMYNQL